MSLILTQDTISGHFIASCRDELRALKPGNVHVHSAGHGMEVSHFEAAALAAAPFISDPDLTVGTRIEKAVRASFDTAQCNTNLGIILLCAPLSAAAQTKTPEPDLQSRLAKVLRALDTDDAVHAYDAIAYANPAGLGNVASQDVHQEPSLSLRIGMALAAKRDRISNAYVTDYSDIFEFGLPALGTARSACADRHIDPTFAITTLHMAYMARFPDSHIARKHGARTAREVRTKAKALLKSWTPVASPKSFETLLEFDATLKRQSLNPGTTADFVVATLFAARISHELHIKDTR